MADVTITQLNDLAPSTNTYVPISNGTVTGKAVYTGSGNPTGTVIMWATSTPPAGYLECNGAAIDRTANAALFSVLGTTYGAGNGSTTFNLPDLRGEFIRGWDNGRGVDSGRAIGSSQADEFKSHNHSMLYGTGDYPNPYYAARGAPPFGLVTGNQGLMGTAGGTETRPRNIALMYCIRT